MKKKILLIEDNPATIDVVQKELEFLGYESVVAEDGKEGVEKAVSYLPDLIIMDISLPKMDGLEASSLIRKNPKIQSTPILAATARALPGDKEKCIQAGCNDYIAKPFTHRELGAAIKKLLKEWRIANGKRRIANGGRGLFTINYLLFAGHASQDEPIELGGKLGNQ